MFCQFEFLSSVFFCLLQIVSVSSVFMVSHDPKDVHLFIFSNSSDFDQCHELPFDEIPNVSSGFVPLIETRIVIHGFADSVFNNRTIGAIKDAYLQAHHHLPGNIIMVAWSKLSASELFASPTPPSVAEFDLAYRDVAPNLSIVGERVAQFVLNYIKLGLLRAEYIHIIGHSLGALISGYVGTAVRQASGFPIARITGLEPALHVFQIPGFHNKVFLGPDNASFVDVIHSNWGGFGVNWTCGDVDFFPNGGVLQPGCPPPVRGFESACSHAFAITLYAASISNPLMSCKCPLVVGEALFDCKYPVPMGLYCPPFARQLYCLQTPQNPY